VDLGAVIDVEDVHRVADSQAGSQLSRTRPLTAR
jgi:hypothetical protein